MPLPTSPTQPVTPDQIWQMALGELQLQLTGATFNTWLGRTKLMAYEDGTFIIGVHNAYAQDWLENRLDAMIRRTLAGIVGHEVQLKFVVWNPEATYLTELPTLIADVAPASVEPVASVPTEQPDVKEVGYFPLSRYDCPFWSALLGAKAFLIWGYVRSGDIRKDKTEWTPDRRFSVPQLARVARCGPQSIVGVPSRNQAGALNQLQSFSIGHVARQGEWHDPHTRYIVSVRVRLPLLMPQQVSQLPAELQLEHDRWLADHGFDPRDWFR